MSKHTKHSMLFFKDDLLYGLLNKKPNSQRLIDGRGFLDIDECPNIKVKHV